MASSFVDFAGLQYYDQKLQERLANPVHSFTVTNNAAKNWYRIATANGSQIDLTKPLHVQFLLTAYNSSYDTGYYEQWFVDCEVFGRNAGIRIFGNSGAPFSQARVLYENTIADLDANDRPAIDIYLNYVLPNGVTQIKIEELYNAGWTFAADGEIAVSSVPSGFENVASGVTNGGIARAGNSTYTDYTAIQRSNFSANFTLADNTTYRARTLNCTGTITVTVPSINSVWSWFIIKNFNATSGVVTVHPSTTSVMIDGSNADITLQPGEYIVIHSRAANSYTIIGDGRWKSLDANVVHKSGEETIADRKTFTSNVTCSSYYQKNAVNIDKTATGTGEQEAMIFYTVDMNNLAICQMNAERNLSGAFQELRWRNVNVNNLWSDFRLRSTDDNKYWLTLAAKEGMSFGLATSDNSLAIPTTAWIRTATGNFACNAATADYSSYSKLNYANISSNTTLSFTTHGMKILNCTGTIKLTLPSPNGNTHWFWIKNNGTGTVTVHPTSTSVYFDNVSEDIKLASGDFITLACQSSGRYSIINSSVVSITNSQIDSLFA